MRHEPNPAQMIAALADSLGRTRAQIARMDAEIADLKAKLSAVVRVHKPREIPDLGQDEVQKALDCCAIVAAEHGLKLSVLTGRSRIGHVVIARHHAMAECYAKGFTISDIARAIRRDRSAVLHGIRAHEKRVNG